jgi:hypothetical protein
MTGLAVLENVTVAARAERGQVARAVSGPGHPCADDAALLVELSGNSVRHSRSGDPGELVTVTVRTGHGVVKVTGRSEPGVSELCCAGRDGEAGCGLQPVAGLAARWGRRRRGGGR